jgi:hypothetical protein
MRSLKKSTVRATNKILLKCRTLTGILGHGALLAGLPYAAEAPFNSYQRQTNPLASLTPASTFFGRCSIGLIDEMSGASSG